MLLIFFIANNIKIIKNLYFFYIKQEKGSIIYKQH